MYICVGKWDKLSLRFNRHEIRLCLGFVALAVLFYDTEASQKMIYQWALKTDDELQALKGGGK